MRKPVPPATTLKMRNQWLSFAEEQDIIAANREGSGFVNSAKYNRESARAYRAAAAAYKPKIEGED